MIPLKKALDSSIGRKFVMSISGIALVGFIISHVLSNMTLYLGPEGGVMLNEYGAFLASFGPLLVVAEIGLAAVFIIHIVWAIRITLRNKAARKQNYASGVVTKGGPSHLSLVSRSMIVTGLVLFVFLIVHIWQFRIGKVGRTDDVEIGGVAASNLYAIAIEVFTQPINVAFYTLVMLFLGAHLSHGIWSSLQSMGLMKPAWSKPLYAVGALIGILLAAGFLFIPIFIYITQSGV
ncbi:MAG: succinate dehydrogenase cytochrome b subunit [Bradymonadaceae bacterium]|nr:succinate dehydrogenase cytochrome b subunit [Lujinxingiaceae bacterium]